LEYINEEGLWYQNWFQGDELFAHEAEQSVSERAGGRAGFVAIHFRLHIKKKKQPNWQVREECLLSKLRPLAKKPVFLKIFFHLMLGSPTQFVRFGRDSPPVGQGLLIIEVSR